MKRTIRGSPYIGVFAAVSEDLGLWPHGTEKKELTGIEENLDIDVLKVSIANSPLLGVFAVVHKKKVLLPYIASKSEVTELENLGLKVMVLPGITAVGNIFALNKNAGLASNWISKKTVKEAGKFLGVEIKQNVVTSMDLPGAILCVTDKGFIVNPNVSKQEFNDMEKLFGVKGSAATANYGDAFLGNSVIANSKTAIVGALTSGHELIKIDEGLRGE